MSQFSFDTFIPSAHQEVDPTAGDFECPNHTFNIRVNDVSIGTSLELEMQDGNSVVYDNLEAGDNLPGIWKNILAAGSTCDSVIVQYVFRARFNNP